MTTEWSLDFCLVCDQQILGGAYCSQICRLAELDQLFPDSGPPPPTYYKDTQTILANIRMSTVDFPVGISVSSSHSATKDLLNPTQSLTHGLVLSSSQTSLSSLRSNTSQSSALSDHARNELRGYASCFDQLRDWKRRLTT